MIEPVAKNIYNTLNNTGKTTVTVLKTCSKKAKVLKDKVLDSDTFKKASNYKHKDAILGGVVISGALMLAIKCIKEMHDKIKEIKEK